MGMTFLDITLKKQPDSRKSRRLKFLIDTGAIYTVAPTPVLRQLGIKPHRKEVFTLADGSTIERDLGMAYFEYKGVGGGAPVVFGQAGDSNLLGMTTLESMGLMVDPLTRDLRQLPAMLGTAWIGQPRLMKQTRD